MYNIPTNKLNTFNAFCKRNVSVNPLDKSRRVFNWMICLFSAWTKTIF